MSKVLIDRELLELTLEHAEFVSGKACEADDAIRAVLATPISTPDLPIKAYYYEAPNEYGGLNKSVGLEVRTTFIDAPLVLQSDALAGFAARDAEIERLKHAASGELATRLITQFVESGAVNYQEAHFDIEFEDGRQAILAVVTLQDPGKPTPHMLRIAAEEATQRLQGEVSAQVEEVLAVERSVRHSQAEQIERLTAQLQKPSPCMGCVEQASRIRELEHKMGYYASAPTPPTPLDTYDAEKERVRFETKFPIPAGIYWGGFTMGYWPYNEDSDLASDQAREYDALLESWLARAKSEGCPE